MTKVNDGKANRLLTTYEKLTRGDVIYKKQLSTLFVVNEKKHSINREDVLAISKILLESRAFCKEEFDDSAVFWIDRIKNTKVVEINFIFQNQSDLKMVNLEIEFNLCIQVSL